MFHDNKVYYNAVLVLIYHHEDCPQEIPLLIFHVTKELLLLSIPNEVGPNL